MDVVRTVAAQPVDGDDRPTSAVTLNDVQVLAPPGDVDLLDLVPGVYDDVRVNGLTGILEVPRFIVAGHPAQLIFSGPGTSHCALGTIEAMQPSGTPLAFNWTAAPADACTFEASLLFLEAGSHHLWFNRSQLLVDVLPWNEAYLPFTGTLMNTP
jgi:hypothetical protein